MPSTEPGPDRAAIVARLRAAGCVFAEDEAELLVAEASSPAELERMTALRVTGHPLEQVLGSAEFCGHRVEVDPTVFVPRRRTGFLVETAVALAPGARVVVDLCCGTGAIGLAIARRRRAVELHAADIDPVAVGCARRNLAGIGTVYLGDLFDPLPPELHGRVDLLTVNAPYVPTGEIELMPPEARIHEARTALDGGADGLDVHRRVAAAARGWLAPDARLLIETAALQAQAAADILEHNGLPAVVTRSDELAATVVVGTNPR